MKYTLILSSLVHNPDRKGAGSEFTLQEPNTNLKVGPGPSRDAREKPLDRAFPGDSRSPWGRKAQEISTEEQSSEVAQTKRKNAGSHEVALKGLLVSWWTEALIPRSPPKSTQTSQVLGLIRNTSGWKITSQIIRNGVWNTLFH